MKINKNWIFWALFVLALLLIGAYFYIGYFAKTPTVTLAEYSGINYNNKSPDGQLSQIKYFTAPTSRGIKDINISFKVKVRTISNYNNIFQTDAMPDGMRIELGYPFPKGLFLITQDGKDLYTLSSEIEFNRWYSIKISKQNEYNHNRGHIKVWLDDAVVVDSYDNANVRLGDLAVGTGFNRGRPFDGQIKDFNIEVTACSPDSPTHKLQFIILLIIAVLFIAILILLRQSAKNVLYQIVYWLRELFKDQKCCGGDDNRQPCRKITAVSGKKTLVYLAAILSVVFLFAFFSPGISDPKLMPHVHTITAGRFLAYENGDAPLYIHIAQAPQELLNKNSVRQSRPFYILGASIIGYPFVKSLRALHLEPSFDWLRCNYLIYTSVYIFFNLIIVLMSMLFFDGIFVSKNKLSLPIILIGGFFVINEITKTFFWTGTPVLLSLLIPVVAICFCRNILLSDKPERLAISYSFVSGLLWLLYGSFIVVSVALLVVYSIAALIKNTGIKKYLFSMFLMVSFSILPLLIWIGICYAKTGTYYNHEVAVYRQFVWTMDVYKQAGMSGLLNKTAEYLQNFVNNYVWTIYVLKLPVLLSVALGVLSLVMGANLWRTIKAQKELLIASSVWFFCSFLFFWFLGYFGRRLAWNLVPSVLAVCGVFITGITSQDNKVKTAILNTILACIMIGWLIFIVCKDSTAIYWSG